MPQTRETHRQGEFKKNLPLPGVSFGKLIPQRWADSDDDPYYYY